MQQFFLPTTRLWYELESKGEEWEYTEVTMEKTFTSRIPLFFAKFFSELLHVEVLLCHYKDQKAILTYVTTRDCFSTPGSTGLSSKSKQGNPIRSTLPYKLGILHILTELT